jgi:hypothetical protein
VWSGSNTTSGLQVGGSDATSYSTGPPLIERWPFYGRCWYRFVSSLSALDFFQAARTALDFLGKILTMRSRQRVVIVYPSCIGITVITCQALLAMDSSGLVLHHEVTNPWRPYP